MKNKVTTLGIMLIALTGLTANANQPSTFCMYELNQLLSKQQQIEKLKSDLTLANKTPGGQSYAIQGLSTVQTMSAELSEMVRSFGRSCVK